MAKASNVKLDIQSGTTRTIFASWTWSKTYTENYKVMWYYGTGDGIWFVDQDGTSEYKQSTYTAPDNALKVKFKVKPISKKHTVNDKEVSRWTANWSTEKILVFDDGGLAVPPVPTVTLDGLKLTAKVDNVEDRLTHVEFQVVKNDDFNLTLPKKKIAVDKLAATLVVSGTFIKEDSEYKVRCRGIRNSFESEWTDYSSSVTTQPAAPEKILECRALTSTSVYLDWKKSKNAESYEIQYVTKKSHFDSSTDVQSMTVNDGTTLSHAEVIGLETGNTYYFRVRANNENGTSGWSPIKSVVIGREPSPPTTWSSKTTAKIGDDLELYWVHNAEDGSNQSMAMVELVAGSTTEKFTIYKGKSTSKDEYNNGNSAYFNVTMSNDFREEPGYAIVMDMTNSKRSGQTGYLSFPGPLNYVIEPRNCTWNVETRCTFVFVGNDTFRLVHKAPSPNEDEGESDGTFAYVIDTTKYTDGTKLKWRACTKGLINDFSPWSVQRTVDLYSAPTLEIVAAEELDTYPYRITVTSGPTTQKPIGYHLSITAGKQYNSIDEVGQNTVVGKGQEVFSAYFDTNVNPLELDLLPGNVQLANNITYTITCSVSTDAGLSATDSTKFKVVLGDIFFEPNAAIGVDPNDLSATIRPYCEDSDGNELDDGFLLSVYRREYDGSFTPIEKNLEKSMNVVDPHPALDYARYRIVAISEETGDLSYYDVPGYPVGEKAAVIQWNESWHPFDTTEESAMEDEAYTSTMVKLPYNLDVSDSNKSDVAHVNYIGRKHPVSYYGTHVGETSTWNVEIPKTDSETLYALRCLQKWMGDVYVREPSGSGYWASVSVSFSQKHRQVTIPVTINITRVEGGV